MVPWIAEHILILVVFSPLVGIALIAAVPKKYEEAVSEISLSSAGITFVFAQASLLLFSADKRFSLVDRYEWLEYLGVSFQVGVDGLGILLVAVSSLVFIFAVLLEWKRKRRGFFITLLFLEAGMMGLFVSLDIFLMHLFMEMAVVSFGLLNSYCHSDGTAQKIQFFPRYTGLMLVSGAVFLSVTAFLVVSAGTGDITVVEVLVLGVSGQIWLFSLLVAGTFIRTAIFPLHSWIGELSTSGRGTNFSLTGIILIGGAYFFYRLLPPFAVAFALMRPYLAWFIVSSIIISTAISVSRSDIVSLFAYIVMFHLNFVLLGFVSMTRQGFAGAGFQMVSVILSFLILSVIFEFLRRRGVDIGSREYRGILSRMPVLGLLFFTVVFAISVLPGLSHFPGFFMIWMGLFKDSWVLTLAALAGVLFAAVSLIRMSMAALYCGEAEEGRAYPLTAAEVVSVVPFVIALVIFGLLPDTILQFVKHSTEAAWLVLTRQL